MTSPSHSLAARLQAVLDELDTSPGFDERVMARVRMESDTLGAQEAAHAREIELQRHAAAKRRQSWLRWLQRAVTLDTIGVVVLAGLLVRTVGTAIAPQAAGFLRVNAPLILTAGGAVLALSPLAIQLARTRFSAAFA